MIKHSPVRNKFVQPNTTQTPNCFFDYYIRILGHAELKITAAVIRHTYGWHEKDFRFELSLTDFEELTGLARANIQRALKRLIVPGKDRPAILGRKIGRNDKYAYWLLVVTDEKESGAVHDTSTPENGKKSGGGVHEACTGGSMLHSMGGSMQHVQPKDKRNFLKKPIKREPKSSSVPTAEVTKKSDDDSKISVTVNETGNPDPLRLGKPNPESDDIVIRRNISSNGQVLEMGLAALWFGRLSNGTPFSRRRDFDAYKAVLHVRLEHFQIGLVYSVGKSKEHKLGSLNYAVNAIVDHYNRMKDFAASDLRRIAVQSVAKALWSIKSGIWLADNFSDEQWQTYKREIQELAQTV